VQQHSDDSYDGEVKGGEVEEEQGPQQRAAVYCTANTVFVMMVGVALGAKQILQ
jgi:hypothetical protein